MYMYIYIYIYINIYIYKEYKEITFKVEMSFEDIKLKFILTRILRCFSSPADCQA